MSMIRINPDDIKITSSFGYNKSKTIYYSNLSSVNPKNGHELDCFIIVKSKKSINGQYRISHKSYIELRKYYEYKP